MTIIYDEATVYLANELTFQRGDADDILWVGVYHNTDPNVIPAPADFTEVDLIVPPDPLADGAKVDVLSKIGPGLPAAGALPAVPAGQVTLTGSPAGTDYQRWVAWRTTDEFDMRATDTITVRG